MSPGSVSLVFPATGVMCRGVAAWRHFASSAIFSDVAAYILPSIYCLGPMLKYTLGKYKIQFVNTLYPGGILYKSIAGRYRPVIYPDGPITARYRFVKNASWVDINPSLAKHDMPSLSKQCRSKSVGFWSGSALFVIQYVNLYWQSGSRNLIGWKLEMGVAS